MKNYFIIIGIFVIVITGLITLNVFFQQSLQLETAEQFNKQQLLVSKSIAFNVAAYLSLMKEKLASIVSILKKEVQTGEEVKGLAEHLKNDKIIGTYFGKISAKGDIIFFQGNPEIISSQVPQILEKTRKIMHDKPYVFSLDSYIYITYPYSEKGKLKEILFFLISVEEIARYFIVGIISGEKAYAWIINKAGTLLYHPNQLSMVGGNIYAPDERCLKCHKNFDIPKKIIEGKTSNFGRYIDPTGVDKITSFTTIDIDGISWAIAVSSPFSEVTATTKRSMELYSYLIISIFVVASIVSGVLIIFNRKIILANEKAKHQQELEMHAAELEQKVVQRTEELSNEKEKLNTIVSAIGAGILMLNEKGVIQWANKNIIEMLGCEVTGMSCEELCTDCSIVFDSKMEDISTTIMSDLFGHKGTYFQVTTAPIKGANGEIHGYIRLVQDITDMKKMEDNIIHSEKLASIGRLAAGIAHEIGNPMTSIFSFVQILREMEDDKFKKESLDTIYYHINRISEILKQLSGFTRMPQGEVKLCNVNDIIESSTNLIQYDKKAKDVVITKELSNELPKILIDSNRLSQVFVNLILNAFDAMNEGGHLFIRTSLKNNSIKIEFKDTGSGISKENLSKIFDPFFTTKEKGTGLGLAVSYDIIKKMDGELLVESELGKGSTFTIILPIKRDET